ncbi:cytochrome-c peroxidase [Labilithrix luteola]|nr:cytochrome c peroxidase [Labilithrix luteola]
MNLLRHLLLAGLAVAREMRVFGLVLSLALTTACSEPVAPRGVNALEPIPRRVNAPASNPLTEEKRELGRLLFWDPLLSGERDVSCASCHDPAFAYTDGARLARGTGNVELRRNTPTVLLATWNGLRGEGHLVPPEDAPMFWDNRARSLEAQARGPLHAEGEMRGTMLIDGDVGGELSRRLAAIPAYQDRFETAFGTREITEERIVMAIASFERGLSIGSSAFDRYARGDSGALSSAQKRGLSSFVSAGCATCHGGPMFSDFELHALGAGTPHRGAVDRGDGRGRFRTPSLRNATRTAPYMHDGSLATLDAVYEFYDSVDRDLDPALGEVSGIHGSARNDVTAFFEALADKEFDDRIPTGVPSGLPVGGLRRAAKSAPHR